MKDYLRPSRDRVVISIEEPAPRAMEPTATQAPQPTGEYLLTRRLKLQKGFKGWLKRFWQPTSIFTLGILICTGVYTCSMLDYTKATNLLLVEQQKANQSSQCTFYTQQRAWLNISKIDGAWFNATEITYEIQYEIGNFRHSLAQNISIHSTAFIDHIPQPPEQTRFVKMIYPQREYVHHHKLNSQQYTDLQDGVKRVEVLVRIEYTDSENIQHYITEMMLIQKGLGGRVEFSWETQDGDSNTHESCHAQYLK